MTEPALDEALYALRMFDYQANELRGSRLLESLRQGKGSHHIQWVRGGEMLVEHDMPHNEEFKAFVLTFRLFLMKNEPMSFRSLRALYPTLAVSEDLKSRALSMCQHVNDYLDANSRLVMNQEVITHRRALQVALYGGLAHGNDPEAKAMREVWADHPALDVTLKSQFIDILEHLAQVIFALQEVHQRMLRELVPPEIEQE
jgi:hypothetical protein